MADKRYKVKISNKAKKQLKKIDRHDALIIKLWIEKHLIGTTNPYMYGKALKGNLGELWRYRVGKYRILSKINDDIVEIEIVKVGHRKEVYEK